MFYKKELGRRGENIALKYYQAKGYKKVYQNFSTRYGELDLVLRKNQAILVVEVKTRTSDKFGYGEESISNKKLNSIEKSYQMLAKNQEISPFYELEICIVEITKYKTSIQIFMP